MKKLIAVFLCMVMMVTMIPTLFASAAVAPAAEGVVAMDDAPAGTNQNEVNRETEGILTTIIQFFQLWGGLFEKVVGPVVMEQFGPALLKVLNVVPFGQFVESVRDIFNGIKM